MKLISWNVNGLRAVLKKGFLDYLETEQPDIIGLQETKLQLDQIPNEIKAMEGYHQFWSCADRKGYSGVALFTKEEPIHVEYSMNVDEFDSEGRTIIAEFKDFVVINSYFPNGQKNDERLQYKLRFYDRMLEIMNDFTSKGKKLYVMGDYNTAHKPIDLKNPKANEKRSGFLPIEREWLDKIIREGYVDTFREYNQNEGEYSWWTYRFNARTNNAGWRIDYFFCNESAKQDLTNAFIQQQVMGSDHCPVGIEIS
jgi:exodeoxyribonuclease-3